MNLWINKKIKSSSSYLKNILEKLKKCLIMIATSNEISLTSKETLFCIVQNFYTKCIHYVLHFSIFIFHFLHTYLFKN